MLKTNQRRTHANPLRSRGAASAMEVVDCNKADMRNQYGVFQDYASMPQGFRPPTVWLLAPHDGSISSYDDANGGATVGIVMVDGQNIDTAVEGGAVVAINLSGVAFLVVAAEGDSTATASLAAIAEASGSAQGGAVTSLSTTATAPFAVSLEAGSTAEVEPTKVVFIAGASLTEETLTADSVATKVWQHPSGVSTKNNTGLIPALL